jgi:hypothetical protein
MKFSFSDTHYNSVFGVSRTKNKKRTPEALSDFYLSAEASGIYLYDDSSIIRFSSLGP